MATIGSLFSGIGGLDLGISQALREEGRRVSVSWFCDQDVFARQVMKAHHPKAISYDNLYSIATPYRPQFRGYPKKVSIITAGFPCKNISIARLKSGASIEGIQGNQSGLIIPSMALFRKLKPEWIVLENVSGVIVDSNMRYIVFSLVRMGYSVSWAAVPAGVLDAAHLRDRIFILAKRIRGYATQMPDFPVFSPDIYEEVRQSEGRFWKQTPPGLPRLLPEGTVHSPYVAPFTDQKIRLRCALNALGNAVSPPCAKVVGLTLIRGANRPEYPISGPVAKLSRKTWKSPSPRVGPAMLPLDLIKSDQRWPRAGYVTKGPQGVVGVALPEPGPIWAFEAGRKRNVFRPHRMNSPEERQWLATEGRDPRWPTPVAMLANRKPRDPTSPGFARSCEVYRDSLTDVVQQEEGLGLYSTGEGRTLNPEWVEWLMGFPPGWTWIRPNSNTGCTTPGPTRLGSQPRLAPGENPQLTMFARE